MNKRQIAAQETKNKLIRTALELFKQNGFYDINVEDITRTARLLKEHFIHILKERRYRS
ncbi:MAG: hypothetical protein ACLSA2_10925 [Candidatus Gastranaerophilaceae bacterium]